MRMAILCVLTAALCCGVDCLPRPSGPSEPPGTAVSDDPANPPTTDSPSNPPVDSPTDVTTTGTGCQGGTFVCSDGPDWSPCGTWYFNIEGDDAVVGGGRIDLPAPYTALAVTLTGTVDPTADALEITITVPDVGSGTLHASSVGPTLELTGDWSFTHGPETGGDEIVGQITGTSCQPLP